MAATLAIAPATMHRLTERFPLHRGAHPTRNDGMCAMEMVAWLAGEPHSDEPRCSCPVIAAFVRATNDVMTDAQRNRHLRPLVPILVNTRMNTQVEQARGFLVLDCLIRRLAPAWLRRRLRHDDAKSLEQLAEIVDAEGLAQAAVVLHQCAKDLHAARWVVQRATDGMRPGLFVSGAVQIARALGDERTWLEVVRTIEAMSALSRREPVNPPTPDAGAAPFAAFGVEHSAD